jgi:hypothetical protein
MISNVKFNCQQTCEAFSKIPFFITNKISAKFSKIFDRKTLKEGEEKKVIKLKGVKMLKC